GHRGQPLHPAQQFLEERRGLLAGISIANRIEGYQIKILRVESLLKAQAALYAEPHISGEQQQHQRRSHLAQYQPVAKTPAAAPAKLDIAALLERGCKIRTRGLK